MDKDYMKERLLERMEEEYEEYLLALRKEDVDTIISSSDRTNFYANMILHIRTHSVTEKQLQALLDHDRVLENMYFCCLENDFDLLARADIGNKIFYQSAKDAKYAAHYSESDEREQKIYIYKDMQKYLSDYSFEQIPVAIGSRLKLINAASKIVDEDLDYVNGIDGLSNALFYEREVYEKYLERIGGQALDANPTDELIDYYATRICLIADSYGWELPYVTQKLKKYMGMQNEATM